MNDTKKKKKLSEIEGGIERYGNSFLIGGKWKSIITACCGKCGKPVTAKNKKAFSSETYYGYVFSCECGNEIELRILKGETDG